MSSVLAAVAVVRLELTRRLLQMVPYYLIHLCNTEDQLYKLICTVERMEKYTDREVEDLWALFYRGQFILINTGGYNE